MSVSEKLLRPTAFVGDDPGDSREGRKAPMSEPGREFLSVDPTKGYEVRMATDAETRSVAWALVYRVYRTTGYAGFDARGLWYGIHDALPETGTILVLQDDVPVGTVTVIPDTILGLPADAVYKTELGILRDSGRNPVEVGSLAVLASRNKDRTVVTTLFDVLSLYSRDITGATDLVMTVNPKHERFYKRMLLFERIGDEKEYEKVEAPSILMRLDLERQREAIRWEHHEGPLPVWHEGKHTMYRFFSSIAEENRRIAWLERVCRPLDGHALRRYFVEQRSLIPDAPLAVRRYFEGRYPGSVPDTSDVRRSDAMGIGAASRAVQSLEDIDLVSVSG